MIAVFRDSCLSTDSRFDTRVFKFLNTILKMKEAASATEPVIV